MEIETYLGDGAYVALDDSGPGIAIYTNNGVEVTNIVWLGQTEIEVLIKFIKENTSSWTT